MIERLEIIKAKYDELQAELMKPETLANVNKTTELSRTWWTQATQFPIKAKLTIKGLLRPSLLMSYVRVNTYFYGKQHISSGLYIITKQEDLIDSSGYRTTLSLTRIESGG